MDSKLPSFIKKSPRTLSSVDNNTRAPSKSVPLYNRPPANHNSQKPPHPTKARRSPVRAKYISDGQRPSISAMGNAHRNTRLHIAQIRDAHRPSISTIGQRPSISAMGVAHRYQRWASPIDINDWATPIDINDWATPTKISTAQPSYPKQKKPPLLQETAFLKFECFIENRKSGR
jgi:hypothetical protein